MNIVTKYWKWMSYGFIILVLCLLPLLLGNYLTSILVFIGIYAIVGLGLGLLIGYAGQISFGHNAFYGIGGYTSAILSFRYGISPWLGILSGMILTAIVSYVIGKPILRLRGHMLVIVTTAVGLIFWGLFGEMDFITGGYEGFSRIPRLSIGGLFTLTKDLHYYYLVFAVVSIAFVVASNIGKSKIGREFRTIDIGGGGSETAAEMLGVNIGKIKVQVFVLSAIYASIGGSLYVHYLTHVDPSPFDLWMGFLVVIMVVIGGARSLWGPIVGAAFYYGLKELISYIVSLTMQKAQSVVVAGIEVIIFSLFFIIVVRLFPEGLVGLPRAVLNLWNKGRINRSKEQLHLHK